MISSLKVINNAMTAETNITEKTRYTLSGAVNSTLSSYIPMEEVEEPTSTVLNYSGKTIETINELLADNNHDVIKIIFYNVIDQGTTRCGGCNHYTYDDHLGFSC